MKAEERVKMEPKNILMGRFQKERTDAISDMFDNEDEYGIYPTTKFFVRLDDCVRGLLEEASSKSGDYRGFYSESFNSL